MYLVRDAVFPGHADSSFYFHVAENLASGRGPNVDYVWHFLAPQDQLTHFAFDYWMPLNSMLMALPLWFSGGGLSTALTVCVMFAAVLALATALIASTLTDTRWIPPIAAVVVLLLPAITRYSICAEASISFTAIGAFAFAAALHARERQCLWLAAGALAAFAHLSRNEGLLLVGSILLCVLFWSNKTKRLQNTSMVVGAYLVVMSPFVVVCMVKFGTPLPTASRYFPFIVEYEDLYRFQPLSDLSDLRSLGRQGNIDIRLHALVDCCLEFLRLNGARFTTVLLVLTGVAIGAARRDTQSLWWRSSWQLPIVYALAVTFLYIVITPGISGAGGWSKNTPVLLPFLVIAALIGIERVSTKVVWRVGLVALLIVPPLSQLSLESRRVIDTNNSFGAIAGFSRMLDAESECANGEIVVMTRDPWEFTQATGYRSVQIPNEPLDVILDVAERFRVTHILPHPKRPQLGDLDSPDGENQNFQYAGTRLYRVRSPRTADCQ